MVAAILASAIGASEGAIKLLVSIGLGYPLALLHRLPVLFSAPPLFKHVVFFLEGMGICYYNFGIDSIHSWLNVTIVYLVLLLCGGTKFSVIFVFVFNTCYLVIGYYTQITFQEFGISWTMPQCVLTLKLTGVAFDYYDGQKKKGEVPADGDAALSERPGYLEMLGHSFFFGGVLVGPQFPMKRYLKFVNRQFVDKATGGAPDSVGAGLKRMLVGLVYIAVFQAIAQFLPNEYLYSPAFGKLGFLTKCALILIWGKNSLHKYIGVWLFQEGSIIMTGMSYNGEDHKGAKKWDGCANIKVWQLETGESFSAYIQSFNVNTNQWMSKYIFKRLRFLGSKTVSQLLTLFYLALWHGLQSGYYMCFFLELLETNAGSQLSSALNRLQSNGYIPKLGSLSLLGRLINKVAIMFLWSYALVSFVLLDYDQWIVVYRSVYFFGHFSCLAAILLNVFVRAMMKPKSHINGVHTEKTDSLSLENNSPLKVEWDTNTITFKDCCYRKMIFSNFEDLVPDH